MGTGPKCYANNQHGLPHCSPPLRYIPERIGGHAIKELKEEEEKAQGKRNKSVEENAEATGKEMEKTEKIDYRKNS